MTVAGDLAGKMRPVLVAGTVLLVGTFLIFQPAGNNQFTNFDDDVYVTANGMVQRGLDVASARWAFTTFHAANWHPLTWLSHLLDQELFGNQPRGHHLTSVAFHAANALLLFLGLEALTGARWRSCLAAAFFAVHPLRVESVAWVAERKDVLSVCLGLLALIGYARYARRPALRSYLAVALCLALSLLAKATLVTLPILFLLLDFWPLGRWRNGGSRARLLAEKFPLLLLSAAASLVTIAAQRAAGAMLGLESLGLGVRLANASAAVGAYLGKILWPMELSVFYPYLQPGELPTRAALSLAVFGALGWMSWRSLRPRPWLAAGLAWYLVALLPVIGIVQVGQQAMADRYTYVPQIGLATALAWSIGGLAVAGGGRRVAVAVACVVVILLQAVMARAQIPVWKDNLALFGHAVRTTPGNWLAWYNLGNTHQAAGRWAEAEAAYRRVADSQPLHADACNNLGVARLMLERPREAELALRRALVLAPNMVEARYNLGLALSRQGRHGEALAAFEGVLALDPLYRDARYRLEEARAMAGAR